MQPENSHLCDSTVQLNNSQSWDNVHFRFHLCFSCPLRESAKLSACVTGGLIDLTIDESSRVSCAEMVVDHPTAGCRWNSWVCMV